MKLPTLSTNPKVAATILRVGLAIVFLYAAIGALTTPAAWEPFLPGLLTSIAPPDLLLKGLALYQIVLVAWLISGWRVRYAALLSTLTLSGIVFTNLAALDITFRDIGLACAALALVFLEK